MFTTYLTIILFFFMYLNFRLCETSPKKKTPLIGMIFITSIAIYKHHLNTNTKNSKICEKMKINLVQYLK